jgi:branched-chain amino acid transport system permease protein
MLLAANPLFDFLQQVISGALSGTVYASLALALVLIYRAMDVANFAQGEMAMFATFLTYTMTTTLNLPFYVAFVLTIAIALAGGVLVQRVVIKPFEGATVLTLVIVTLGLFSIFNGLAGLIWGYVFKNLDSPFPSGEALHLGPLFIGYQDLGVAAVTLVVLALVFAFFRFTSLGLAMRAAAQNPVSSRLVGVRVGWMLAFGWGLAGAIGSVAGMMAAPIVYLDPNMMSGILLYGFAAALLGGIDNAWGAVIGGFIVGIMENLAGAYVVGTELKLTVALIIIVGVLVMKPSGLFGRTLVTRV